MYTSHGHHIPNTPVESEHPARVARCGGPGICQQCSIEILHGLREQKAAKYDTTGAVLPSLRSEEKARLLVAQYVNARIPEDSAVEPLKLSDIYLVWFGKTLQNWKALVTTNIPDGMFFEVTYNGDKRETYLDAYVKWQNVAIPDGGVS
jgi:ferredoxin